MFQRLYDRVICWSAHRRAPAILSVLSFTESSFFPIPPDVMLIPMCLAKPARGWFYAAVCTLFSVLGGMAGYLIGRLAFGWIEPWLMQSIYADAFTAAVSAFDTWGFWYILLAGFTPIPYKVFTISAGVVGMPFPAFIAGSTVGRGGRFFLVAALIRLGGENLAQRLRKYVDWIGWSLIVLAVLVFVIMKFNGTGGAMIRRPAPVFGSVLRAALLIIAACVALNMLTACGSHQPAPVEEQSTLIKKRRLDSDGTYSVRTGDTLYAIAFHYGMDPQALAVWNGIDRPYVIYPGQKLRMLAPKPGSPASTGSSSVKVSAAKPPARATTKPADTPETVQTTPQEPPAANAQTQAAIPVATPVDADPESWRWPTQGRVARGYVANNPSRNGLDIAGSIGQPIHASAPGQVVYSGNGLIGYGELIIIRHSEKMLSAYAHNRVRLVKEGDQVSAGQKIAEMGRNTGNETLLHFEIRVRGKPVNPLNYLPKQQ